MTVMASRNTGQSSVCPTVCSDWQKRNIKGPRNCPFVSEIPAQRDSNTENVSIWWRHRGHWVCCMLQYQWIKPVPLLTHWGRVTHICVGKLANIGSDNGLSPGRRQAIIWINAGTSLIGPLGTNFSEILIGIQTFSFKKMHLKMSSAKWRPFYLGLNELTERTPLFWYRDSHYETAVRRS